MKTFEEKIAHLEELSARIRDPEIGIEDALGTFEEGIKLAKELEREIDKIEGKIRILKNQPLEEMSQEEKNQDSEKATEEDDSRLQLDLFEMMSAPSEGLRQNG